MMRRTPDKMGILAIIAPGVLVAATGVGAGDLATASLTGSLLGVWQAVPYLFADMWRLHFKRAAEGKPGAIAQSTPYRLYMVGLALIPVVGLFMSFKEVQKLYAVIGAAFLPLLALVLLILNQKRTLLGKHRNSPWITASPLA